MQPTNRDLYEDTANDGIYAIYKLSSHLTNRQLEAIDRAIDEIRRLINLPDPEETPDE